MPANADALTGQGFRDWVGSILPVFVETNLANRLVEEGYDRVSVATHVDEELLRGAYGVKPGHAKLFVNAALAVHKALGYSTSTTNALVTSTQAPSVMERRIPAPKVPHAGSATGCGVAGLGTVAAIRAWMLQLISWTRSNWGEAEAMAIADINRDSGAEVFQG